MNAKQIDPKYSIEAEPKSERIDGQLFVHDVHVAIVNLTGVPIPDDEPLILFRARDWLAIPMLEHYKRLALADNCTDFHIAGIDNRIEAFQQFKAEYPERMKQPGVTRGA